MRPLDHKLIEKLRDLFQREFIELARVHCLHLPLQEQMYLFGCVAKQAAIMMLYANDAIRLLVAEIMPEKLGAIDSAEGLLDAIYDDVIKLHNATKDGLSREMKEALI